MERLEATRVAVELAGNDVPIVGGVGNSTFDLAACDRPLNFYMWNSMGMAPSIGLGLALARPDRRVLVLAGDGSLLMNLSALPTTTMAGVRNLVLVVWDNAGWEITGGQPAGSAFGVDLEGMARASGFARTATVDDLTAFRRALGEALAGTDSWVLVARVAPGDSPHRPTKNLVEIRDRFSRALAAEDPRNRPSP